MSLVCRITCLVVLLCSFLLIIATGRSNIRNFEKVQASIEEIYKDRLVVKGLIYQISSLLHKKELAIATNDLRFLSKNNDSVNSQIADHLQAFRKTKLTEKEEATLDHFSRGVEQLKASENEMEITHKNLLGGSEYRKLKVKIESLKEDLQILSEIQLEEGEQKLKTASYAVKQMNEFASIETIALIIIGMMMLALIFAPLLGKNLSCGTKKDPN